MRGPLIRRRLHAARQVCCGPLRSGLTDEINPFSVRFCARYRLRCRANPSHGPARSDLRRHGLHPGVPHRLDHSDDQVPIPRPDHQRAPGRARDHSAQHDGHGSDEAGWRFELADPPALVNPLESLCACCRRCRPPDGNASALAPPLSDVIGEALRRVAPAIARPVVGRGSRGSRRAGPSKKKPPLMRWLGTRWRSGRDSNPRPPA